jgi:predicted short-subunit dehydrogenase-like oxidoreductase (DUF2520 family)
MLPGMAAKPSIAIVGAGNLARALAFSLVQAGYRIDEVIARSRDRSLRNAKDLARKTGARAAGISDASLQATVVWFCVPDGEIAQAAQSLAAKTDWKNKIALHSSGALSSDELDSLQGRGAAVASVHPLMTFVRGEASGSSTRVTSSRATSTLKPSFNNGIHSPFLTRGALSGVPFAIEGDAAAVKAARRIVKDLGGIAYAIRQKDKAAYHAWGTFASPLLTALLATTERVAGLARVKRIDARRMLPILLQTLTNYAAFGAAGAFSGPIVRGDVDTVKRHLQVLRREPVAREVYLALARAALEYLPAKNKNSLRKLLNSASY